MLPTKVDGRTTMTYILSFLGINTVNVVCLCYLDLSGFLHLLSFCILLIFHYLKLRHNGKNTTLSKLIFKYRKKLLLTNLWPNILKRFKLITRVFGHLRSRSSGDEVENFRKWQLKFVKKILFLWTYLPTGIHDLLRDQYNFR